MIHISEIKMSQNSEVLQKINKMMLCSSVLDAITKLAFINLAHISSFDTHIIIVTTKCRNLHEIR